MVRHRKSRKTSRKKMEVIKLRKRKGAKENENIKFKKGGLHESLKFSGTFTKAEMARLDKKKIGQKFTFKGNKFVMTDKLKDQVTLAKTMMSWNKKSRKASKNKPKRKSRKASKKKSRKPKKTSRKPKRKSRKASKKKSRKASKKNFIAFKRNVKCPKGYVKGIPQDGSKYKTLCIKKSRKPKRKSRKTSKKKSRKPKRKSRKTSKKKSRKPKRKSRKTSKKKSRKPKRKSRKPKRKSRKATSKKKSRKPKRKSRKASKKKSRRTYKVISPETHAHILSTEKHSVDPRTGTTTFVKYKGKFIPLVDYLNIYEQQKSSWFFS